VYAYYIAVVAQKVNRKTHVVLIEELERGLKVLVREGESKKRE
jgi:hypothetical protein